ncbi:MAG: DDE transposase [Bacteroidetes bacterium 4572_77]|nr:MAG: DDE transposase [Bacteroidetes bacterium 4572_77]
MTKIRKILGSAIPINFYSKEENFDIYWQSFLSSRLGEIYQSIPWQELIESFHLQDSKKGRESIFSPRGKIALQILKSYTGLSDRALVERLNSDYQFQFFCDVSISVESPLKCHKILSDIRTELGLKLNIQSSQEVLSNFWKPYMTDIDEVLEDATCYESSMRYPTDAKLLWEANEWIFKQINVFCKTLKIRKPRNKYGEQKSKQLSFSKKKRKTKKQTKKRIKSLLYLLNKLLKQLSDIMELLPYDTILSNVYFDRLDAILTIVEQQEQLYKGEKVKDRIVSIDKAYIRPIVRGKESKRVEFGAKANIIQVDGINMIDHISFNAFNEGIRLEETITLSENLFKVKVKKIAGDNIYANNNNRSFCTKNGIITSFVKKGKRAKDEEELEQVRKKLATKRATKMEGAFGTQKNHYGLNKIYARTKENELLWIFFGILWVCL